MEKIKNLKNKFINTCKKIKEEHLISKYIKNNKIFVFFVLVNVINSTLLRILTMPNAENIFALKPIIADLAVVIIIGSFNYLFHKGKSQVIYLSIITFIFTAICTINSVYYTFYTSFASFSMLSLTQFIAPVGDAVVENVLQIKDLVYLIPTIAFYVYCFLKKKQYKNKFELKRKRKDKFVKTISTGGILVLLFCVTLTSLEIGRFVKQWNKEYVVQRFGIYVYQVNDGFTSLQPKISSMFGYDEAARKFREYFKKKGEQTEYTKKNEYTDILKGKNVLVIHAESLQTIALNTSFNGQDVAPNFKRLASEGIYFSNYYSQVSVGTSSDAELSFNTSLMPTKSGTAFVSYSDRTYTATPQKMKELGYYTFSMHGNTADFWNRRVMHKNFGFDKFYSKVDYNVTKENTIGLGISDKAFFSQSVDYEALGEFINKLDEKGLLDNTVVVIYGDHDARLPKKDYNRLYNYDKTTDSVKDEDSEGYVNFDSYQYELNRKVPFIIWTKDKKYNVEVKNVMGMYDAMPTLGNMLGFSNKYALGHDIFNIKENNIVVFPNGNWVTNKVYYNAQKGQYLSLNNNEIIDKNYISENTKYAEDLLSVSNDMIVFDLVKKENEKEQASSSK